MHQGEGQVWLSLKVNNRSKAFGLKLVKMNNITKKIVLKLLTVPVCKLQKGHMDEMTRIFVFAFFLIESYLPFKKEKTTSGIY